MYKVTVYGIVSL